jgi:hypothetical protein
MTEASRSTNASASSVVKGVCWRFQLWSGSDKLRNLCDTATGTRLLVPQDATILGEYKSASLVFGNERLPSVSLTLALRDGRSVDLGDSPVMNQAGMAGLVSRVDQHWWRNLGAVLIMGVLRGGHQAVIKEMGGATGSGAVASGIASTGMSADRLYGFGHIILQSSRRGSVGASGALVADVGPCDRGASATRSV